MTKSDDVNKFANVHEINQARRAFANAEKLVRHAESEVSFALDRKTPEQAVLITATRQYLEGAKAHAAQCAKRLREAKRRES